MDSCIQIPLINIIILYSDFHELYSSAYHFKNHFLPPWSYSDFIEQWVQICNPAKSKVKTDTGSLSFSEQCTNCEKASNWHFNLLTQGHGKNILFCGFNLFNAQLYGASIYITYVSKESLNSLVLDLVFYKLLCCFVI